MEGTVTLTINAAALIGLVASFIRVSNAITRLTTIQEQHEQRITRLENRGVIQYEPK